MYVSFQDATTNQTNKKNDWKFKEKWWNKRKKWIQKYKQTDLFSLGVFSFSINHSFYVHWKKKFFFTLQIVTSLVPPTFSKTNKFQRRKFPKKAENFQKKQTKTLSFNHSFIQISFGYFFSTSFSPMFSLFKVIMFLAISRYCINVFTSPSHLLPPSKTT